MDALLLACFAPPGPPRAVDLGCGCGPIGLAWLLKRNAWSQAGVLGLDLNPAMIQSAQINGRMLGLHDSFDARLADIRDLGELDPESADLVLANPPYRRPGSGRANPSQAKRSARFEEQGDLKDFAAAAARLLCNKAPLCMIHLAEHLPRVLGVCTSFRLEPKRVRCVHSRQQDAARLVLVEARKNGKPGLTLEAPLFLYHGNTNRLTDQALAFCPFLACNAGSHSPEPCETLP